MIKAEVVFDGDVILVNGFSVMENLNIDDKIIITIDDIEKPTLNLEQAIKCCLEQSK